MRGRKPNPTNLNVVAGTYQAHPARRNASEPEAVGDYPVKPTHLAGVAGEKWDELYRILSGMGLLSVSYAGLMRRYAETFAAYQEACERVAETGQVLPDFKRNPWSVELRNHRDALLKMEVEMGLTPSAKARVHVETETMSEQDKRFFG